MKLTEVLTSEDKKAFLELPLKIYKEDPNWIRPLDKDIEGVFDKKQNKFFRHGEAIRWLLKDNRNEVIGRVAAFINKRTAKTFEQPTGGMGFFECVNDQKAANILFDQSKKWLEEKGMEAMDGPINFGERDRFWGLLVDGFTPPTYCVNYNPPYYKSLFENYGFKIYFEQYTYSRAISEPIPEHYRIKAERIRSNPGYRIEHLKKSKLNQYAEDFRTIYNEAWGGSHKGHKAMRKEQAKALMAKIKPIMDERLIWYAYYENRPIGFFIMLPEINQIIRHLNGKFGLWQKLKFLWHLKTGTIRKIYGVVFGIVPDFQGKGLEGAIIQASAECVQPLNRYDRLEIIWIGDFNPKMINIVKALGTEKVKTHYTYRYLFDRTAEFKRAPMI